MSILQRGFDSGTADYVFWDTGFATQTPLTIQTTPTYTGSLSAYGIISRTPPVGTSYVQRGFDTGTGGYVYWETASPDPSPAPIDTIPNYTGTLTNPTIVRVVVPV